MNKTFSTEHYLVFNNLLKTLFIQHSWKFFFILMLRLNVPIMFVELSNGTFTVKRSENILKLCFYKINGCVSKTFLEHIFVSWDVELHDYGETENHHFLFQIEIKTK